MLGLLGMASPVWMLAGAAMMLIQKQRAIGRWVAHGCALLFIALGAACLAGYGKAGINQLFLQTFAMLCAT